ncbi:MAG: FAD-dependent oxidoreductase [Dehalococcoidales bacterium]|nr:MAG: FAD-dependent oxidoreductase [Dehalococcoidales bacterium]
MISLIIDEVKVTAPEGTTILEATLQADIYIPHICSHPFLPAFDGLKPAEFVYQSASRLDNKNTDMEYEGCQLCVVNIEGSEDLQRACNTPAVEGMVVHTDTQEIHEFRRDRLTHILSRHPHACLTCAQKEGCARFPCSTNVSENERCCPLFSSCEFQRVAEYIGIKPETSRYVFEGLSVVEDKPLFKRDYNLCIGCTRCIRVCRDVMGVGALDFIFDEDGQVVVGTVGPTLRESTCRFCTACVEVCPTGALLDKEEFTEAPCQTSCPAGIDVPRYVYLLSEGKFAEAAAVIRETVPFPRVLGYICPHDCELKCRRGELNEPIAIRALKRFAAEHEDKHWKERLKPVTLTGKKVAVVGSGPAGLSAAYYLTRLGHSVTIFETASKPGGMMQTAIPRFLLPQEVLDEEIEEILSSGIELRLNSLVESIGSLLEEGYDAALLAIGLQEGSKVSIPGSDLEEVLIGLDFLRDVSKGKEVSLGQKVLVLGGGGVACDVARTAKRLGAQLVSMVCLESRETMPAPSQDISQTEDEGIEIIPSRSIKQILGEDNRVKSVECLQVKWVEFDEDGKLHLETVPNSEHILEADTVIFATGQSLDYQFAEKNGLELNRRGTVKVFPDNPETNLRGVFVSGDALTGPASVVEAVAAGRRAAISIDTCLGGEGLLKEGLSDKEVPSYLGRVEGFAEKARINPALLPPEERVCSFKTVELSLDTEYAMAESIRCLRCNLRSGIPRHILPPQQKLWIEFNLENVSLVPELEGVYRLLDEHENVIYIKGALNLRQEMEEQLGLRETARYFAYEEDPMYTQRESQLLQQYIAENGQMPEGNRELDDLF